MTQNDRLFLCFKKPGSRWVDRVETRRQPLWDEHAAYIDTLFAQGSIVMAGPYADWSGALVIVRAQSDAEARALFDDDPWNREDILHVNTVREWVVFLDDRPAP
jgi:uncharacterized protein YciI